MVWGCGSFSVFPVSGRGDYPIQAINAEKLAARAVDAGCRSEDLVVDAAGPQTFTFEELLRLLVLAVGARVRLVHSPPSLGFTLTWLGGPLLRDVVLTKDEVDGLMAGLLTSDGQPTGTTGLGDWLRDRGNVLGRQYVSELRRNYRREKGAGA